MSVDNAVYECLDRMIGALRLLLDLVSLDLDLDLVY